MVCSLKRDKNTIASSKMECICRRLYCLLRNQTHLTADESDIVGRSNSHVRVVRRTGPSTGINFDQAFFGVHCQVSRPQNE